MLEAAVKAAGMQELARCGDQRRRGRSVFKPDRLVYRLADEAVRRVDADTWRSSPANPWDALGAAAARVSGILVQSGGNPT